MYIDAKGLTCPMPLLKAKQALRKQALNTAVTVATDDDSSPRDFKVYAEHVGLDFVCKQGADCYLLTLSERVE